MSRRKDVPVHLFDGAIKQVKYFNSILNSVNKDKPKLDDRAHVKLIEKMWEKKMINIMCDPGDSGSFVLDKESKVVGLLHSNRVELMQGPGKQVVDGYFVYHYTIKCYVQRINDVVRQVNEAVKDLPKAQGPWEVCVESVRKSA